MKVSQAVIKKARFQFTHPGRGATVKAQLTEELLKFQFTHPGRGATLLLADSLYLLGVSIHAPREGCD